jgi:hypothetical protein
LKKKAQRNAQAVYMDFAQQLFNLIDGNGVDTAPIDSEGEDAEDQILLKATKK